MGLRALLGYVTLRYVLSDGTLDFFYHFFQDARVPHPLNLEAFSFSLLDFIVCLSHWLPYSP